jgi:flagellar biosynthesis anti-sigma factor FlgM
MRIDSNQGAQSLAESSRSAQPQQSPANTGSGVTGGGSTLGEDQAQLSGAHVQIRALTAQALQFPEVRQEKVNALRQVLAHGTYQPASKQVADAVFSHMLAVPAA